MDDSPLESVLTKPHSSIHVGLEMVKRGDASAFVSAGNSGAVMAAAMMILGTLPGVDRPAIASLVPDQRWLRAVDRRRRQYRRQSRSTSRNSP